MATNESTAFTDLKARVEALSAELDARAWDTGTIIDDATEQLLQAFQWKLSGWLAGARYEGVDYPPDGAASECSDITGGSADKRDACAPATDTPDLRSEIESALEKASAIAELIGCADLKTLSTSSLELAAVEIQSLVDGARDNLAQLRAATTAAGSVHRYPPHEPNDRPYQLT